MEAQTDDIISKLMSFFDERAASKERIDLARKISFYTIDMISQIAFGEAFGYLDADVDLNNYVHTTEKVIPILVTSTVAPFLATIRQSRLFAMLLPMKKLSLSHYEVLKCVYGALAPHKPLS